MRGKSQLGGRPLGASKVCPNFNLRRKFVGRRVAAEDPSPMQYALASLDHSLIIVKFSGGIALYHPRYERPKKLISGGSKIRSYCSPFVDQSSPHLVSLYGNDRGLQRHFPIARWRYSRRILGTKNCCGKTHVEWVRISKRCVANSWLLRGSGPFELRRGDPP